MNLDEAVKKACEEPTLLGALSYICVWDCDRAVRQALDHQRTGVSTAAEGSWDTCFKVSMKAVTDAWGSRGASGACGYLSTTSTTDGKDHDCELGLGMPCEACPIAVACAREANVQRQYDEANKLLVELAHRAARGRCEVHDEPLVLVWRREEPANMNGAPRTVCPDCLEERVEKLEAGIRAEVEAIPDGVTVREDGAGEDVLASLAVSVGKTRSRVAALEGLYAAAVERLQDLGETEVPLAPRAAEATEATEAAVFVGEVSKDARPRSWGWKLRLFRPDAPHSYATVLSGRLFEDEREAVEDAEKVAREAGATVRRVVKASCVGSAWMEPEKVGR